MRYMNPGFKDWGMIIGASSYLTETTDTSKTKTGIAFANGIVYSNYLQFDYPASGEVWVKFDFYADDWDLYFGEPYGNSSYPIYNGFSIYCSSATRATVYKRIKRNHYIVYDSVLPQTIGLKHNAINAVLFHLKWATENEDGYMDLQINDFICDRITSADLLPLYEKARLSFGCNATGKCPVSNIIISDEPISIKEQIVALPITGVETDMTYDSDTGIYTASAINQSLLASVDVADLISNYGDVSKVTGVAIVGNPAFRTAEGLSSFTALTKKNNTVTEYGAANIPADSDSVVANSFKVASDTTIGDLANMQLGLKVGG